jgi:hypothetical protein
MKKIHRGLLAVAIAGTLVVAACSSDDDGATTATTAADETTTHAPAETAAAEALRADLRALWEDHVVWTRLYIVSAVAGLPDADATLARLLQNQTDIGGAIATYYGDDAGAQLTTLLEGHIATAGELLAAAKAGDTNAVTAASTAWYANADEIAAFLAGANPAWPEATLQDMMRTHLDQTLAEATAQLTGDYAASVTEYDHIVAHILEMSDALAAGIVTQFPDRFTE